MIDLDGVLARVERNAKLARPRGPAQREHDTDNRSDAPRLAKALRVAIEALKRIDQPNPYELDYIVATAHLALREMEEVRDE